MRRSRRMSWARHIVRMGLKKNAFGLLVENPEGKRAQGRPSHRRVDNINMDLR
jgi:hypothetical protein